MDSFALKLNDSLRRNETVVFAVNCSVTYDGRAKSSLAAGDRLVMIKPDGTLLIHQPKGSTPVNYMKEGTHHTLKNDKKGLFLVCSHLAQKEFLKMQIHKVHYISSSVLVDSEKISLNGSEKDMSDMIYSHPELIEEGFTPLSREEHTKFGFIDVFGHDKNNTLVIIECKRYTGDPKAVEQLRRYVEKMKKTKGLKQVRGILAAPRVSPAGEQMLKEMDLEFLPIKPPNHHEEYNRSQATLDTF